MGPKIVLVRFKGTGTREYFELGMCVPRSDGSLVKVIYTDREVEVVPQMLSSAIDVNVQTMLKKATVLHSVKRDGPLLRRKLPDYEDFFDRLDADYDTVSEMLLDLRMKNAPAQKREPVNTATNMISEFIEDCSPDDERLNGIISNIEQFKSSAQKFMPTSWLNTRLEVTGMKAIELTALKTMRDVTAICKSCKLEPPSGFVKSHSYHYGKYNSKNKLISFLSLSTMRLNNTPGSIAVSIDIAASTDKQHSMSIAINSIVKMLRKRRNKCVIFAQVAKTDSARTFWSGKLTKTKRASLITALFSAYDDRYKIYYDAEDMALFFD